MSWNSPASEDLNGILRGYQIDVVEESTTRSFTLQVLGNQHLVSLLHPHYSYMFAIAATTVGNGPFGNTIAIQTDQDGKNVTVLYIY